MSSDMVIFVRTYDLLTELLPLTAKFPRPHRFVVTKRLQDAALDFQEHIIDANTIAVGPARLEKLHQADAALRKLRLYLRLVHRWGWLSRRQYTHTSERVAEIGKLLGGWIKATQRAQ